MFYGFRRYKCSSLSNEYTLWSILLFVIIMDHKKLKYPFLNKCMIYKIRIIKRSTKMSSIKNVLYYLSSIVQLTYIFCLCCMVVSFAILIIALSILVNHFVHLLTTRTKFQVISIIIPSYFSCTVVQTSLFSWSWRLTLVLCFVLNCYILSLGNVKIDHMDCLCAWLLVKAKSIKWYFSVVSSINWCVDWVLVV